MNHKKTSAKRVIDAIVVKDYKTGEEKITVTDIDGEYEFRNI